MEILLEIRMKTGLSQYKLADYLGVSRSLVSLAEKGLRELPLTAHLKATDMLTDLLKVEAKGIPLKVIQKHEEINKVQQKYHEQKLAGHQYQVKFLDRRLSKMQENHGQASNRLNLVNSLTLNENKLSEANSFELKWLEYHEYKTQRHISKKEAGLKMLEISIEQHKGYAAVHEKILNKFFSGSLPDPATGDRI